MASHLHRALRAALCLVVTCLTLGMGSSAFAQTADLFISEYIEGTSNNKAIEIYNGTGAAVNLSTGAYKLLQYNNGALTPNLTVALTGTIAAGDVYVVANSSSNAAILAQADQTNGNLNFNGNDAIVLVKGATNTVVDAFGQVGNNPGTEWGTGLTSTADNTLVRKVSVCAGDVVSGDAFDPSIEWDGFAVDTLTNLGTHSANCASSVSYSCSITPTSPQTLVAGTTVNFTYTLVQNPGAVPVVGANVSLLVTSGPNTGANNAGVTNGSGQVTLSYTSNGTPGTDSLSISAATTPSATVCTASVLWTPNVTSVPIVINEVDADQTGTDATEFVELYDGGVGNTPLDGLVIVFWNGSNDLSYSAFDLDGKTTNASGYFILGSADITSNLGSGFAATNFVTFVGTNAIQNGQDAVALYTGEGSAFPTNTPLTLAGLRDALVYDNNNPDDPGLLTLLNAGQPQIDEKGGGDGFTQSMQRCPNGSGGLRNTSTFTPSLPTPGAANAYTNVPTSAGASPSSFCLGGSVQLSAVVGSDETVSWYEGSIAGPLVGTGTPVTVTPSGATTYYAVSKNLNSTCVSSGSTTVLVSQNPDTVWYQDSDGDGFGDPANTTLSCSQPVGYVANADDGCPADGAKQVPGVCGCGTPDTDSDGDGTPDCNDGCPNDPNKIVPGACGCGALDTDTDGDGISDCNDGCPNDPNKTAPGVCGCGSLDTDSDGDGTADCNDGCPSDPNKTAPGVCGCGVVDTDSDGDGTADCNDGCPSDPNKTAPGVCGCGSPDADSDGDGTPDCNDGCPSDPNKTAPGTCGCGNPDTLVTVYVDGDGDGFGNSNAPTLEVCANAIPSGYVTDNTDCNDGDATIHPGATEICGNGIDEDCNGVTDDGFGPFMDTFVDDDWALLSNGTDPDGAGPAIAIGCDSFATIQQAIDAVSGGGTVHVATGFYSENLVVDHPLTISGPNAGTCPGTHLDRGLEAVIRPAVSQPIGGIVLYVTASDVTIDGITIDGDQPLGNSGEDVNGVDVNAAHAVGNGTFDDVTKPFVDIDGLVVKNTIIVNFNDVAVLLYGSGASGTVSDFNVIECNRFDNMSGHNSLGYSRIATLLYNDTYAKVDTNVLTRVSVGVQTGNNYQAKDVGSVASISSNQIEFDGVGIWHNLHYANASSWEIALNQLASVGDKQADQPIGLFVSSIQGNVGVVVKNNNVSDSFDGVRLWNLPTTNTITVDGGTLVDNYLGVHVTNFDDVYGEAAASSVVLKNLTIFGAVPGNPRGVFIDGSGSLNAMNCEVTNVSSSGFEEGVAVEGDSAGLYMHDNPGRITGNNNGVVIFEGKARIETTDLTGNLVSGVFMLAASHVDLGDCNDTNFTGLGSSVGLNNLTGYDGITSWAVFNQNFFNFADVLAENNYYGYPSPVTNLDDVIFDDTDAPIVSTVFASEAGDSDGDGTSNCFDLCPLDPMKIAPGACGCGVPDTDSDGDGTPDCTDGCPSDPTKVAPGACGCGTPDLDSDGDGTVDCLDGCPNDPAKTSPGTCGCGLADTDSDGDGTPNCIDNCPNDPNKIEPGTCGCGTPDIDSDGDGFADCVDGCPADPHKSAPGTCGCGTPDVDSDGDGVLDCIDGCPTDPSKTVPGACGCGVPDTDSDGDGTADCNDGCPSDPNKTAPGTCGCGVADIDSDGDGTLDCLDGCPADPLKTAPGICGCGVVDADTDGDGAVDCIDLCPNDPNKSAPGACGCGVPDTDSDGDGVPDCNDVCPGYPDNLDCNENGIPDGCDIHVNGTSGDINHNDVPDECECIGDLDASGTVDGADLAILLGAWGNAGGVADLNADGTVDGADLAILLGAWGICLN